MLLLSGSPHHLRALTLRAVASVSGRDHDLEVRPEEDSSSSPRLTLPDGRSLSSLPSAAFALSGSPLGLLSSGPAPGCDPDLERAHVLEWLFRAETTLWPLSLGAAMAKLDDPSSSSSLSYYDESALRSELTALDVHLGANTFLCCERLSVSDLWSALPLALLVARHRPELAPARLRLVHLDRWLRTVLGHPKVEAVLKAQGLGNSFALDIGLALSGFFHPPSS